MQKRDIIFKVLLLGDGAVGKTALAQRYLTGRFPENIRVTIGASFYVKKLIIDGVPVTLQIWDLGGEERFRFIMSNYCKGAAAAMFLYDITNLPTLYHLDEWLQELRAHAPKSALFVIGSKSDLTTGRKVQLTEAINYARERGAVANFELSAKTGDNVNATFEQVARLLLSQMPEKKAQSP